MATLIAGLAHEIGTPMGVIQGHAKLLEPAVNGEDAKWRLETIQEQIGRITKIIQALLKMSNPERRTRHAPVQLEAVLDITLSFLSENLARNGIELIRRFEQAPVISGDSERLQQVFLNLFMNAVDAMPTGGSLTVSLAPVARCGRSAGCRYRAQESPSRTGLGSSTRSSRPSPRATARVSG